ncbi:unnamed protein product [Allacma fusca]|uniref:Tetraspanin n=1 Tax=Allacma fusca TaxID=39272 RepID=A0A8J2KWX2_9HEXA|nr:unnamed protein product [Allacma fusca]
MGVTVGVVQMCSYGASIKSMVDDPTRNGTISVYVTLISVETFIFFITLFGMYIAFRVWRNNYQIDHSLRHQFIIWLACWGVGFVFCLVIGIYMIIKSKDSQENMAVLYDTFFRNSQDQKFVATFEKFQRENQCCGIYTPNDWFIIQFRQRSGGIAGGGGGGGFQDYDGYNQNPSTGKCHLTPPTLPPASYI